MPQKMMIKIDKEWVDGYEFIAFGLESENIAGVPSFYTTVICKDGKGYLEARSLYEVRFL